MVNYQVLNSFLAVWIYKNSSFIIIKGFRLFWVFLSSMHKFEGSCNLELLGVNIVEIIQSTDLTISTNIKFPFKKQPKKHFFVWILSYYTDPESVVYQAGYHHTIVGWISNEIFRFKYVVLLRSREPRTAQIGSNWSFEFCSSWPGLVRGSPPGPLYFQLTQLKSYYQIL